MQKGIKHVVLLLFISLLFNCQTTSINIVDSSDGVTGVYIAGYCYYGENVQEVPCYWKNGECIILPTNPITNKGEANSIFVTDKDVFVSGNLGWKYGCFWKNGNLNILSTDSITYSHATQTDAISIYNNSVYVVGYWEDTSSNSYPCYWRDKQCFQLKIGNNLFPGMATSISIVEDTIYIAGRYKDSSGKSFPCYWKNDECITLPTKIDTNGGSAGSIFVNDHDIYVTGTIGKNKTKNCYWKNQECFELFNILPVSVFISSNDIYISGLSNFLPHYWKNNTLIPLTYDDSVAAWSTHSVFVTTQNIYVIGESYHGSTYIRLCYWKNNELFILPVNSQISCGTVRSIFVIE